MENMKQIKSISQALNKEKEIWLSELGKIISAMEKKQYLISKMLSYQKEYDKKNKLELSKTNPLLHKNFDLFYKKMLEALFKAESEFETLKHAKLNTMEKVQQVEKRISVMKIFQERVESKEKQALERAEQTLMSDMAVNKLLRGNQ